MDKLGLGLKPVVRLPFPPPLPVPEDLSTAEDAPTPAAAPALVELISDGAGLTRLEREWDELLAASDVDCLFLTWEWLHTWWRHQSAGRRLHILAVRRAGRLIALAPLALRPAQPGRLLPMRALEFMGMGDVGTDYLDVIVRRGEEDAALAALGAHLAACGQVLELRRVRVGSRLVSRLASSLQRDGWAASQTITDVCPLVEIGGHTWDSYLAGVGSAHRQNVRRRLRRIAASFRMDFQQVRSEAQRREVMPLFMQLHRKRWNGRRSADAMDGPGVPEFHEEFTRLALQRGWLRLYLLRLDGVPAASIYALRYGSAFYFYQSGFDPGYSAHSVGLVSMALTIQRAIEEGAAVYDMLHGDEEYKFLWARTARDLVRFDCYPPTAAGAFYRRVMGLRQGLKLAARWPRRLTGEGA